MADNRTGIAQEIGGHWPTAHQKETNNAAIQRRRELRLSELSDHAEQAIQTASVPTFPECKKQRTWEIAWECAKR